MISIIIPHRKTDSCEVALLTLRTQTFRDYEIIQIEDTESKGASWARNRGYEEEKGNYLLYSDNDIHWYSNALQVLSDTLIAHPECAYSYGAYKMGGKLYCYSPFDEEKLKASNYISTMSLFRKEDFCGFDENIKRLQDWDIFLNLLLNHNKIGVSCEKIIFTTIVRDGISFGKDAMPWEEAVKIIKQKYGLK